MAMFNKSWVIMKVFFLFVLSLLLFIAYLFALNGRYAKIDDNYFPKFKRIS